MVSVVQVDRDLGHARRAVVRQAISETDDRRFAIFLQARWSWILTVEAPDVRGQEVGVERMEARPGFQFVREVSWRELGPALMGCSWGFACSSVRKLGRLRTQ